MPIFQRYILREMLITAVLTFGVITLIFVIGGALRVLHEAEILTLGTFLRAVVFFVGTNLDKTLPMTVLVAAVTCYGRAAADNEINTLRASGVHLYTVLAPGLLFGLLGSALVLHVNDEIAPRMEFRKGELVEKGLAEAVEKILQGGVEYLELGRDLFVAWQSVDDQDRLVNVVIKRYARGDDEEGSRLQDEIRAGTARLEVDERNGLLFLQLADVTIVHGEFQGANPREFRFPISLRDEAPEKKLRHHTLAELAAARWRVQEERPKPKSVVTEYHQRVAGAFACVLFVLLGAPLAIIFKQSNRMVAFLIAFLIALVVYYPTFILGDVLADETDLHPAIAVWSGTIVLLLLGLGLTATVVRR